MAKFTRAEVRKILGEAHTDEMENALIALHLGVTDPMKDELDKAQKAAAQLETVQKELNEIKSGTDWKAEHDKLKKQFDDYKAEITGKEALGKVQAAYRKLLDGKKIAKEDADLIMAGTKFEGMKLKDDGTLDGEDGILKDIDTRYSRYIPTEDRRGHDPATPPAGNEGGGANPLARQIEKARHERLFGKAPYDGDNGTKRE